MLRRVILAGLSTCALTLTFGFSYTAQAGVWRDSQTGQAVPSVPAGGAERDLTDPNRSFNPILGRNYFYDKKDCTWKDSKTGQAVPSVPAGGAERDLTDPNRSFNPRLGRNYFYDVKKDCQPPQEHTMAPQPPGTGFYVGFNAGGASGSSQWLEPAPASSTNVFGVGGWLAGGTVGYAVQNGPVLLGVEADIAGGSISGSTSVNCFTPCRTSNSWLATVRGRAGIDLGPVTPFVTGGLAVGDVNAHVIGFPGAGTTSAGWTAGAGLQLPLTALASGMPEGWTVKAEWLHVDLGSPHVCTPATCGGNANVNFQAEVFRVGINIPLTALMPR